MKGLLLIVSILLLVVSCGNRNSKNEFTQDKVTHESASDYASPATRAKGEAMIKRLLEDVPNERVRNKASEYLSRIDNGDRDFRF